MGKEGNIVTKAEKAKPAIQTVNSYKHPKLERIPVGWEDCYLEDYINLVSGQHQGEI